MSKFPDEIKNLINEACSLEYCPVEFRVWAANTLSTGSAAALFNVPGASWRVFQSNIYWAVLCGNAEVHARRQLTAAARAALEGIKHAHDNPRTKSPD